ncbi:MAG: glycosyltransferase [Saprospiraceae bacterium]|nr:glycosyltransferase [Saprospiraceae bacterium]
MPEILFVTSYPPRECGIATYTQDLVKSLHKTFYDTFHIHICALEDGDQKLNYPEEVHHVLNTRDPNKYVELAKVINSKTQIQLVGVQHEFGLFGGEGEKAFQKFLYCLSKPVFIVFHTVLPRPDDRMRLNVQLISNACSSVVVMTHHSLKILRKEYDIPSDKIKVIEHGVHLVPHLSKDYLKEKYGLKGRKVLSTFGLLSSGKGIETTLQALPDIIVKHTDVMFLIIGKTHPGVVQHEGEQYRNQLEQKVDALNLRAHVKFINSYLPLQQLLEYLQLTDIYLFTSKDPEQAVSGTFSYAMSCACPIISTPIPHAKEVLREDTGIIIDFQNSGQLAQGVKYLLDNEPLRKEFSSNTLQRIVPTSWENSSMAYARLMQKVVGRRTHADVAASLTDSTKASSERFRNIITLQFRTPPIILNHLKKMTTEFGMIQFSRINKPDIESGYTLDDNARALVVIAMHYKETRSAEDLDKLIIYLNFIKFCQQSDGRFLNYVDKHQKFTSQNDETNLEDAAGRAMWALGYLISLDSIIPESLLKTADAILQAAHKPIQKMNSTRAMAFVIKGLYLYNCTKQTQEITNTIQLLADRLVQMYRHESEPQWEWFESYLTYANSILPESMLYAWRETNNPVYLEIAQKSFYFLLSRIFEKGFIKVISNTSWLHKGKESDLHGEQPIDVAYTILALEEFFIESEDPVFLLKMKNAFNWFLGKNHLHQIIYNPCTGGCFDGLEENHVNLNQGAESTLSYLMARLTMEKYSGNVFQLN